MNQDTIALAVFDESHLEGAHRLSREANWPHRREDWAMVLSLSRGFVALEDGAVVGTAMMTPFGDTAATINMVIVAAGMRGRGLGRRLMDAALAAAGPLECRLVATTDGLPLYEKLGFRATHEIRQHQGVVDGIAAGAAPQSGRVTWAGAGDLAAIAALDRLALGMDRGPLLRLLAEAGRMAVLRAADGQIAGYGVLRPFGRGAVIGPVIADNVVEAQALLAFLMAARAGAFLRVDTPALTHLSPWLAARGLKEVGGGIAMRTGPARPEPPAPCKPFALASQALG